MGLAVTYVDADTFTITGDYTADFVVNRKIRADCGADGYKYCVVLSSSYSAPNTTVNLTAASDDLTINLTEVDWSVVKPGATGNVPLHAHTDENTGKQLDHGTALTGLGDDDHSIYALLAGRAGGQTLYGGNAANEDITIEPTSHATKTTAYVLLAPSGGNVGIGTTPGGKLHVKGTDYPIAKFERDAGSATIGTWSVQDLTVTTTGTPGTNDMAIGQLFNFGSTNIARILAQQGGTAGQYGNLIFQTANGATPATVMVLKDSGNVGIGTTSPDRLLHPEISNAVTNAVTYAQRLSHITSGTAAAGFGVGLEMELEDGGGTNRVASYLETLWNDPATAAYKADALLKVVDSAATREILRGRATGAAAAIGFLGASPVVRQAHIADPTDLATCITAVTSILAALESYGLLATS